MFQALSRSEEKLIRGLHRRKLREESGLFLAEGIRVVEELVASEIPIRLAVVSPSLEETDRGRSLLAQLRAGTTVRGISDRDLENLAGTQTPQGVLVVAEAPRRELADLELRGAATVLILDGVQDPGNLGTLVRTADAFGVAFVAALPGTVDPWNPKSVRAAAGALFRVPVVQTPLPTLMEWMHSNGFTVYGAEAGGTAVDEIELAARAALIVGNEGVGLGPDARQATDTFLAVPIEGHAESLNVAIAAGILLYLMTRRH